MATVGMPEVAVQKLTEDPLNKISMLVMIDAALKLEGENTGEIAQGIGAAIGGIGTEKFRIEEAATKNNIPMYAIVVKETMLEAYLCHDQRNFGISAKGGRASSFPDRKEDQRIRHCSNRWSRKYFRNFSVNE